MSITLPFSKAELEHSIVERWQHAFVSFPDHVALTTPENEQYTYQQLEKQANRIANALLARLGEDRCFVVLLFDHCPQLIISMLAVLKANKAYAVLDPQQSASQIETCIRLADAPLVVTDREHMDLATSAIRATGHVLCIDEITEDSTAPRLAIAADAPAALFFTSGTSQQPKGVVYSHRMILHRIWVEAEAFDLTADDRISGLRGYSMAASIRDVYNGLLHGGALCLYPPKRYTLQHLSTWLRDQNITYFHLPILLYREWLDSLSTTDYFPAIRHIFPSGRKSLEDVQRVWPHLGPDARLISSYASTETSLLTQILIDRQTPLDGEMLSVGVPTPDKTILLLDEHGQAVRSGEIGEIAVRSRFIASGYWRQPELTAQRFTEADDGSGEIVYHTGDLGRFRADGCLELVGRQDSQVKLRGYRVILGDVEAALEAIPGIRAAAVRADEERGRLLAYVVADQVPPPTTSAIRHALAGQLPHYAMPTRIIFLPHFPLLASGKIDRRALPLPDSNRPHLDTPFVAPRTDLEQQICQIWAEILEVDEIGTDDDFFELGGDSLNAMRMVLLVERTVGAAVPPDYFRQPTVAALARHCCSETATAPIQGSHASNFTRWVGPPRRSQEQKRSGLPTARSLIRWTMRKRLLRLKYQEGIQWLRFFAQPQIANWLFSTEYRHLRSLAAELGNQTPIDPSVVQASIIGNFIRSCFRSSRLLQQSVDAGVIAAMQHAPEPFWRDIAANVGVSSNHTGSKLYQLDGLEHLLHAHRQGRGVILLTYHNTGSVLADAILAHLTSLGRVPTLSLERALTVAEQNADDEDAETSEMASRWAAAYSLQAQRILQAGGIVRISNDMNYDGPNSIAKIIGNRHFWLKPGFADLALTCGAAIIPVYSYIDPTGRVMLKTLPSLPMPAPATTREAQIHHLLDLYVAFLESAWRAHPESMGWGLLQRYHARPTAENAVWERLP